jgi:hypothetical protein
MRSAPLEAYDATLHAFCIVPMLLSHGFGIVCIEQDPQDAAPRCAEMSPSNDVYLVNGFIPEQVDGEDAIEAATAEMFP